MDEERLPSSPGWLVWWPVVVGPLAMASVWAAAAAGWGWYLAKRLWPAAHVGRLWQWLCAMGATYVLAPLVARRVFRGVLPNEAELHVAWEEIVENAGHLTLIITAFADRFGARPGQPEAAPQA